MEELSPGTKQNLDKDKSNTKGLIVQSLSGGGETASGADTSGSGSTSGRGSAATTAAAGKASTKRDTQPSHDITGMQAAKRVWSPSHGPPTQATKQSRRTTSLLNLFMSSSHGM